MLEHLEGTGWLEKWERPDGQDEVSYRFTIEADIAGIPEAPGISATLRGNGTVVSTVGTIFPEGFYRLLCADDEILRVKNLGMGIWTIQSS